MKVNLKEIRLKGIDCICLAQCRDWWQVVVCMLSEASGSIKGGEFLDDVSVS
jgi:hypothetical protein